MELGANEKRKFFHSLLGFLWLSSPFISANINLILSLPACFSVERFLLYNFLSVKMVVSNSVPGVVRLFKRKTNLGGRYEIAV